MRSTCIVSIQESAIKLVSCQVKRRKRARARKRDWHNESAMSVRVRFGVSVLYDTTRDTLSKRLREWQAKNLLDIKQPNSHLLPVARALVELTCSRLEKFAFFQKWNSTLLRAATF